jgi:hypothetical protein
MIASSEFVIPRRIPIVARLMRKAEPAGERLRNDVWRPVAQEHGAASRVAASD